MKKINMFICWTLPITFSIVIICFAALFSLYFRNLYYWDIHYLAIDQSAHMSEEQIQHNYNALIGYIIDEDIDKLELPSFGMSTEGEIHFEDVKYIFTLLKKTLYILGIYSAVAIFIQVAQKNYKFLKHTVIAVIAIPLSIVTVTMINFEKSFIIFHQLVFRNNYWIFDPAKDPIINILPPEFFYHSFLLIVTVILIVAVFLIGTYLLTKKR